MRPERLTVGAGESRAVTDNPPLSGIGSISGTGGLAKDTGVSGTISASTACDELGKSVSWGSSPVISMLGDELGSLKLTQDRERM